ncbi:MAG: hypothetical protein IH991_21690 [Planctomycetes bacterium]|nr:hypothetical protein [Planctomycetota bacterium]
MCILRWFTCWLFVCVFARNATAQPTTSDESAREIHRSPLHEGPVRAIAVSADGQLVATVGDDMMCHILDAKTLNSVRSYGPHGSELNGVAFLKDKTVIVSGKRDEAKKASVFFWGWDENKIIRQLKDSDHDTFSLAVADDESRLCVTLGTEAVRLFFLDPFGRLGIGQPSKDLLCNCASFAPDSRYLLLGSGGGFSLFMADVQRQGMVRTVKANRRILVKGIDYAPDGRHCLTAHADRAVRLWDAYLGRQLAFLRGHTAPVRCIEFSPGGKFAASGSKDGVVVVWDIAKRRLARKLVGHTDSVNDIAFLPIGRHLLSASSDGTVRLWSLPASFSDSAVPFVAARRADARTLNVLKDAALILNFEQDSIYPAGPMTCVRDLSNCRNDGRIHGATRSGKGRAGGGLQFDGSRDYVEFPSLRARLTGQLKAISILSWLKYAPSEEVKIVFDMGIATPEGVSILIKNKGLVFALPTDHGGKSLFSGVINNPNEWHHVAAVWDGKEQRIYINGKLRGRVPTGSLILNQSTVHDFPARIGIHSKEGKNLHKRDFEGSIDEFIVHYRALTDEEIAIIYQAGQKGMTLAAPQ